MIQIPRVSVTWKTIYEKVCIGSWWPHLEVHQSMPKFELCCTKSCQARGHGRDYVEWEHLQITDGHSSSKRRLGQGQCEPGVAAVCHPLDVFLVIWHWKNTIFMDGQLGKHHVWAEVHHLDILKWLPGWLASRWQKNAGQLWLHQPNSKATGPSHSGSQALPEHGALLQPIRASRYDETSGFWRQHQWTSCAVRALQGCPQVPIPPNKRDLGIWKKSIRKSNS